MALLSQLLRTCQTYGLARPGDHILVGISGGPDSRALLLGLAHLSGKLGITLRAACIDHGLRREAAAEAASAQAWCQTLGIPCDIVKVDVGAARARARTEKQPSSAQDAARRARHAALTTLARRHRCQRIALGHTFDDQAETILFRIVRGTGLLGLAGIPYVRGKFIRPLLDVDRAAVLRFLERKNVEYVDDPSNRDPHYTRSRVRHEWLPRLRVENPKVASALVRLGQQARQLALPTPSAIPSRAPKTPIATSKPSAAPLSIPGAGTFALRLSGDQGEVGVEIKVGQGRPPDHGAVFSAAAIAFPLILRLPLPGDRMKPRRGRGSRKLQDLFVDAKIPLASRRRRAVLTDNAGTLLFVEGLRPAEQGAPPWPMPADFRWIAVRLSGRGAAI